MSNDYYKDGAIEVEDVIEYVISPLPTRSAWCLANIIKYCMRAGKKTDEPYDDLKKARNYAYRLINGRWLDE